MAQPRFLPREGEDTKASYLITLKKSIFHFRFVQVQTGSYNCKKIVMPPVQTSPLGFLLFFQPLLKERNKNVILQLLFLNGSFYNNFTQLWFSSLRDPHNNQLNGANFYVLCSIFRNKFTYTNKLWPLF